MDFVKVQEALGQCEELIKAALGSTTALEHIPTGKFHHDVRVKLYHCRDMIKQMRDWGPERLEKSFRWLGYIQGMMHAFNVSDLEPLKAMNAPTEEDEKQEAAAKPFRVLEAELQRRLGNLKYDSTDELIRLADLAEKIDGIARREEAHREAMVELRELVTQLSPSIAAWLTTPKATEPKAPAGLQATGAVCDIGAGSLTIDLSDGRTIEVPWDWYPKLAQATPGQRGNFKMIGDGTGIHWPDLDEDLLVSAIVDLYERKRST